MFAAEAGDRSDTPDVLVILTDGVQSPEIKPQYPTLEASIAKLKSRGINIVVVAVGANIDQQNLKNMASSNDTLFTSASYDDVYKVIFNVSATVCGGEIRFSSILFVHLLVPRL